MTYVQMNLLGEPEIGDHVTWWDGRKWRYGRIQKWGRKYATIELLEPGKPTAQISRRLLKPVKRESD